jgi:DNA primase
VNPQRQIFKCFGCGVGGGVIRFVMEFEHIEFLAAARKLAERANIKIPEAEMSAEDFARADLRRRLLALHLEAADFFHGQLMRGKSAEGAREYLKKRGLSAEVAKSWKIGFAPDTWDGLLSHAQQKGFTPEELGASGLFSQKEGSDSLYDRFRGRVMFPICNESGEVIAFSGRVLFAEQSPAKYVNSPETMLFIKGAVLFGIHKSKRALLDKKQAIVCEGQIDLITAFEAGVQNVIAPQGTAFTERQARILRRYVDEVVLCFDADAAGDKAAERSLPYLLGESLLVRCVEMPPGEDPDSLIRKSGGEAFAARVAEAKDFFEFQVERLTRRPDFATPRGKRAAAEKLAEFISMIRDAMTRELVLNNTAVRLGVEPATLRALLKKPEDLRRSEEDAALDARPVEAVALDKTQQMLVLLAMRHAGARVWLQARGWQRLLDDGTPGSALVGKVLDADFRADDAASINTWLTSLAAGEEATLSTVLTRELPPDPKEMAEDCWHELERREVQRRLSATRARNRQPGLSLEELSQINQELLELQRELAAIPPRRRPPL